MYRVMLVDERPERLSFISSKLDDDGCCVVACVRPNEDLLACVREHDPEVIIIDIDSPGRDTLESLRSLHSTAPRPMLMFTQDDQGETIRQAVEAGISAYVVDGLQTRNVRPIVEAAMARFRQFRALEQELAETRLRLVERKQVERAKGILMQQRGLSEDAAYRLLRRAAMERNKRIADIAESIVTAHEMLGGAA
jgi:two-component system, response regulator / RNA-binding antiterminator